MPDGPFCTYPAVRSKPAPPRYGQGKRRGITQAPLRKRKKRVRR